MSRAIVWALVACGWLAPAGFLIPGVWARTPAELSAENKKSPFARAISAVIARQQEAWNQGDLSGFLSYYAHTKTVAYVSGGEVHKGFTAIEKRYLRHYGNDKTTMGRLTISDLEITELGDRHALAIGKFCVLQNSKEPVKGRFSLVFERCKDGWKIIYDHSSV